VKTPQEILDEHACFIDKEIDEELFTRVFDEDRDVSEAALRKCRCGARIDGFDEYSVHLAQMFTYEATLDNAFEDIRIEAIIEKDHPRLASDIKMAKLIPQLRADFRRVPLPGLKGLRLLIDSVINEKEVDSDC